MASTTALYTGLSGLQASSRNIDVTGNNIANVNTTAFKSSRLLFQTAFARTISGGSAPSADSGGTNPFQVGLGVQIAGTQRSFAPGSLNITGSPTDLAIDGEGFFIADRGGERLYTRAGAFGVNEVGELVTIGGERVQGFAVDDEFNIIDGVLSDIRLPAGLTLAESTGNVALSGNLNAAGDVPTGGTLVDFDPFVTAGGNANAGTLLSDLVDPDDPASPLLAIGQSIELNGARKGNIGLPTVSFLIEAVSTVQNFADFLIESFGIQSSAGLNPDGATPGSAVNGTTGVLSLTGNTGDVNDIELEASDLRLMDPSGAIVGQPFIPNTLQSSDGESIRTSALAYDSLGSPVTVGVSLVLDSASGSGTTWRYYVDSPDDTVGGLGVANGLVQFDSVGRLVGPQSVNVAIDRDGTGALDPLVFALEFDAASLTAFADSDIVDPESTLRALADGAPLGNLASTGIGNDGVIVGAFTNGLTRTLGQIALATFTNEQGLIEQGSNFFREGPNSGDASVQKPLQFDAGLIVPGALEQSNVDLSQEFIDLILASTGYSAAARVITTTDQLFQQLLVLGR